MSAIYISPPFIVEPTAALPISGLGKKMPVSIQVDFSDMEEAAGEAERTQKQLKLAFVPTKKTREDVCDLWGIGTSDYSDTSKTSELLAQSAESLFVSEKGESDSAKTTDKKESKEDGFLSFSDTSSDDSRWKQAANDLMQLAVSSLLH